MFGVMVTVSLLWALWMARGKLDRLGLEFIRWNPTPAKPILLGVGLATAAGLTASWLFRNYHVGPQPAFSEVWMGVTLGPLLEEILFRGYLFGMLEKLLGRWAPFGAGWITAFVIAATFALGHLVKNGITAAQIATVFGMGGVYGWLRLTSGSTVPPAAAHIAYNVVIFSAAAFLGD
jgi:membrane protease YdiL (CAAX protease family)